ncbi:MAG: four helix bundle protein [Paludibacteraceae bacterium]|nr:four helix bundle protein [Paludibacteraceae bacterium]MBQ8705739.1 four helix bundle protein [Paludibacteraceae bacterium]
MDVAQATYQMCENIPNYERYGLISQMQRAAVSIPSNIAEGAGRATDKEFSHFVAIAVGSAFELYTQVLLAERIGYIDIITKDELISQISELQRMLVGYKKKLDGDTPDTTNLV